MGSGKRQLLAQTLDVTGCGWVLQHTLSCRGLLVLNYHRIGSAAGQPFDWGLWSASEEQFDEQVRFVKQFDVIGPPDLEQAFRDQRGRYVMITFDDGYRDNYEAAFEILRAHGVGATFFLSTGFLDRPRISWWDEIAWMVHTSSVQRLDLGHRFPTSIDLGPAERENAIRTLLRHSKNLPGEQTEAYLTELADVTGRGRCPAAEADGMWMTWNMVREMHAGGMWFGSHTVTHPILSRHNQEVQTFELRESRRRIHEELGIWVNSLSYPVGGPTALNETTLECLKAEGYRWAFRYGNRYRAMDQIDPFQIPRVAVESESTAAEFRSLARLPQVFA